ncbi:hypothetical protein SAMN04489864_10874 [Pedobacter insulae]|uniref:Uncharacterized protein n=2 Tax=Pedobacter insulae TaxID=414048 RepID=A0A1I2YTI5_9SPHI|nr:hypothetical protein SAMN04489864_10874 [Pedobacter insulae]
MLWVFSLAITPWSAMHSHEEVRVEPVEKHCTHKFHFKTQQENCLICKAHFEKNYTASAKIKVIPLQSEDVITSVVVYTNAYSALISTSLRGPPTQIFS